MERVGVVGLGIMGGGMAANLLRAGFEVTVWNRTPAKAAPLAEAGAEVAGSPAELAQRCGIVVVCVSDTPDVLEVVTGDRGILDGARPGQLVIDCSTISPGTARHLAGELGGRGIGAVDAPVSGGSEGAANGTLSAMVGGSDEDVARARPVLDAFCASVTHVGPAGAGQATKLVNQILVVVTMLGVSEALVFAKAQGLDLDAVLAAVSGGAAGSWMLGNRGPQVIDRDWRPGFTIDLQQKDLRLVLEAADDVGAPVLGTALVHQLYRTLQRDGLGGEGNHALAKVIERLAGLEAGR